MSGFFTINRAPRLGVFAFDAVTNSRTTAKSKMTKIPLESGAEVNDHRIREANTYVIQGGMSNSPLKQNIDDIFSLGIGAASGVVQKGINDTLLNLGLAYTAGSDSVRSPTAAALLLLLKESGEPITVSTGLLTLENMVIETLDIEQNPNTDNGFIFTAQLSEWMYIKSSTNIVQASDLDQSVQEKATSKALIGEAGTETVSDQSWASEAFDSISEWVKDAGVELKESATRLRGSFGGGLL